MDPASSNLTRRLGEADRAGRAWRLSPTDRCLRPETRRAVRPAGLLGSEGGSTVDTAKSEAANVKDTAAGAASGVTDIAKSEVSNVASEAKYQARNLVDQTRSELRGQVE